jgi:uncharacterized repeat protein (TIGR02543 family)
MWLRATPRTDGPGYTVVIPERVWTPEGGAFVLEAAIGEVPLGTAIAPASNRLSVPRLSDLNAVAAAPAFPRDANGKLINPPVFASCSPGGAGAFLHAPLKQLTTTSSQGARPSSSTGYHFGVDYRADGDPVYAMADGVVKYRQPSTGQAGAGNWVGIETTLPDGTKLLHKYMHLDAWVSNLAVGQTVKAGTRIGTSGESGTDEPHLHVEVGTTAIGQSGQFGSYYDLESCISSRDLAPIFTVTTSKNGTGEGAVTVSPAQPLYAAEAVVTINAVPAAGSVFGGWGGDCAASGTASTCTLTVTADRTVSATFTRQQYRVSWTTSGSGSVSASPAGPLHDPGTVVTLNASPATGWDFQGWGGACNGTALSCTLTVGTADLTATAAFQQRQATLTVTTTGPGSVTPSPAGPIYPVGSTVMLSAVPQSGAFFVGWGGACSGTANTCTLTMSSDRTVTAQFAIPGSVYGRYTLTSYPLGGVTAGETELFSSGTGAQRWSRQHFNGTSRIFCQGLNQINCGGGSIGTFRDLGLTADGERVLILDLTTGSGNSILNLFRYVLSVDGQTLTSYTPGNCTPGVDCTLNAVFRRAP